MPVLGIPASPTHRLGNDLRAPDDVVGMSVGASGDMPYLRQRKTSQRRGADPGRGMSGSDRELRNLSRHWPWQDHDRDDDRRVRVVDGDGSGAVSGDLGLVKA